MLTTTDYSQSLLSPLVGQLNKCLPSFISVKLCYWTKNLAGLTEGEVNTFSTCQDFLPYLFATKRCRAQWQKKVNFMTQVS